MTINKTLWVALRVEPGATRLLAYDGRALAVPAGDKREARGKLCPPKEFLVVPLNILEEGARSGSVGCIRFPAEFLPLPAGKTVRKGKSRK